MESDVPVRSRIAPTPSGYLHAGNACNFLLCQALTRARGGKLILRIDDLDNVRMRQEYLDDIFYTLDWLGIEYDEGPFGTQDHLDNFRQQYRMDSYLNLISKLQNSGDAFACQCSRSEIKHNSTDGQYPGTCRDKNLNWKKDESAFRVLTPKGETSAWKDFLAGECRINLHDQMRDFVIRRKDGIPAYQIASLADDLAMNINLIVRGKDLMGSTAAQLFLAQQLGEETFQQIHFFHHPLLTDNGLKLSKSQKAPPLKNWREKGRGATEIYRMLGQMLRQPNISSKDGLMEWANRNT